MLPVCTCALAGAASDRTISAATNCTRPFMRPPTDVGLDVASSGRSLSHRWRLKMSNATWALYQTARTMRSPFHMLFVPKRHVVRKVGFILLVMKSLGLPALLVALAISAFAVKAAQPPPRGPLTIDQLIDIRHPSNAMWAPDGRHVVFVWDRAGVSKVYVADLPGSAQATAPRELPEAGSTVGGAFWSADGRALMMPKNGDLWRVPIDGGKA